MKRKKFAVLIAAVLMLLSATIPAYAASASGGSRTKITASLLFPDVKIEVSVPATGKVFINPLKLPVKISGKVEDAQIVTNPAHIENLTEVPVRVSAAAAATVKSGSDMTLAAATTRGLKTTLKKAFLYFEIQATANPDAVDWDDAYDAEKHLVVRTTEKKKKDIVILAAGTDEKRYGAFRLAGDCVEEPKSGWTAKDSVTVNIVFTFTPLSASTEVS